MGRLLAKLFAGLLESHSSTTYSLSFLLNCCKIFHLFHLGK